MRICDLRSPCANLSEAYEQLEIAWQTLKDSWSDTASQAFEDNYMVHVRPRVSMTLEAAGRLASVYDEAQRACEHKREQY
jgi:hypothetical protein